MSVRFNKLNEKYNNYNFGIGQKSPDDEVKKPQEVQEVEKTESLFKGLKNEEDLLTKNIQSLYGINFTKNTQINREILESTNEILAQLGYSYKVNATEVASVSTNLKSVVLPALDDVEKSAVESHIMDPNGPFADLFC